MVWFPKQADIKLALSSGISINTLGSLASAFEGETAIEGYMKDISWNTSTGDGNVINLLGEDTNGYQNAELEETPPDLVEVSGTLILPGDEGVESLIFDGSETITGGFMRYKTGLASRKKLALMMSLDDGTDQVNVAIVDAILTNYEVSVTGADGHFEVSVSLKCLAKNFKGPEFKD